MTEECQDAVKNVKDVDSLMRFHQDYGLSCLRHMKVSLTVILTSK